MPVPSTAGYGGVVPDPIHQAGDPVLAIGTGQHADDVLRWDRSILADFRLRRRPRWTRLPASSYSGGTIVTCASAPCLLGDAARQDRIRRNAPPASPARSHPPRSCSNPRPDPACASGGGRPPGRRSFVAAPPESGAAPGAVPSCPGIGSRKTWYPAVSESVFGVHVMLSSVSPADLFTFRGGGGPTMSVLILVRVRRNAVETLVRVEMARKLMLIDTAANDVCAVHASGPFGGGLAAYASVGSMDCQPTPRSLDANRAERVTGPVISSPEPARRPGRRASRREPTSRHHGPSRPCSWT